MIGSRILRLAASLHSLWASTRGGVAIIGALSLVTIIGMGAFAVEASRGYSQKVSNQRIADMAALAGALAYNAKIAADSSDSAGAQTAMTATAKALVVAQGLAATTATVALVTDATTAKQLVSVTVTTSVPIALARVLTAATAYDVTSVGMASVSSPSSSAGPCITALSSSPSYGIDLTGGTTINAPGCAIATNAGISVPNGVKIGAKQVDAGKDIYDPGSGITTTPTAGKVTANKANAASDWAKDNAALKAALCKVNKLTGTPDSDYADNNTACTTPLVTPTPQTASGAADVTLGYQPRSAGGIYAYQTADYSCVYNFPAGNYTVGKLTVPGGCSLTVANGSTLKLDSIDMSGSGMTIGDGSLTVVGTFGFNSGSLITIGNGAHSFGTLAVTGGRTLNIGSGNLTVTGAITMDGGSYIRANVGAGDSVAIGNNGSGTAISVGGGSYLCFTANCATPSAATGGFSANGSIATSGGSTIIFNQAASHAIAGDLNLNGSSTFGAGLYVIKGGFTNNTGGTMTGTDVSFALGGVFTLSGGTSMELAAPGSGSSYGVPSILIATKSSASTKLGGGSSNKYAGLVYAPKSALVLDGGASLSSASAGCLMLIVDRMTMNGGTAVASSCTGLTGSSSTVDTVILFK